MLVDLDTSPAFSYVIKTSTDELIYLEVIKPDFFYRANFIKLMYCGLPKFF